MDHMIGEPGHDHGHSHEPALLSDYYLEQLLTILLSSLFAVCAIISYTSGMLKYILAPDFHLPVMIAGVILLLLSVFRGIAVWKLHPDDVHNHDHSHTHPHDHDAHAHTHTHPHDHGHTHNHAHDHSHPHSHAHTHDHGHPHEHGENCQHHDHDHHHHGHDHHDHHSHAHDHGHDHSSSGIYWRAVVLGFPIVLCLMGLPNSTLSNSMYARQLGVAAELSELAEVDVKGGDVIYDFKSLTQAAYRSETREALTGSEAVVKGQFQRIPGKEREFQLFLMDMTCCTPDQIPLKARMITKSFAPNNTRFQDFSWVEVRGVIQFAKVKNSEEYLTVVTVKNPEGLRIIPPPPAFK